MTKLVIVDDHEALRDGLAMLLAARGLEVVGTAGTAAAGAGLVERAAPDVAILEAALPDGRGIDLARVLLIRRPDLGIVLYTGDDDAGLLAVGLASGARGYALKAGSADELVDAVQRVAAGDTYLDPRLDPDVRPPPRAPAPAPVGPRLSRREREVLRLMAEGHTGDGIAKTLGVAVETVRTHARNATRKLGARNRVHAIALAVKRGEVDLDDADEPGAVSRVDLPGPGQPGGR